MCVWGREGGQHELSPTQFSDRTWEGAGVLADFPHLGSWVAEGTMGGRGAHGVGRRGKQALIAVGRPKGVGSRVSFHVILASDFSTYPCLAVFLGPTKDR